MHDTKSCVGQMGVFQLVFPTEDKLSAVEPLQDACSKCHRLSLLQEPVSNGIVEVACELC